MSTAFQRRAAIAGACLGVLLFLGANAHLVFVAIQSQPACTATADALPATRIC